MKKTLFLTILCFLISSYINAQDSLYMKCKELPGFSLQNSINLEDSLIINIFDNKYNIVFSQDIQSLTYSDTTISDIDFFEIQLPESKYLGYEDSIGLPHLPSINFTLQIPAALYNNSFIENNIICEYEDYHVHSYYYPYQDYMGAEQPEFLFSEQYYTSDYSLTKYVEVSTPFKAGNTTGIVVKIRPIQYNPQAGIIRIIKSISFDIPINNVPLTDILAYEMLDATEVIDAPILSEDTQLPFDENYLGKLLIVISDETYRNVLDEFVEHKNSKGFETEVVSINQIKNLAGAPQLTAEVLRNYLRGRYLDDNVLHRPRYLLLVGNYDVIPYSLSDYDKGSWFYSDLYYGCLNNVDIRKETDYFPEMFVGRWPVSNISQLQVAINKTITFENTVGNYPAFNNIMMLSGIEDYIDYDNNAENIRYKIVSKVKQLIEYNFLYQKITIYDGRLYRNNNIMRQRMFVEISNSWMFVYVGHGENYMLRKPIIISEENIDSISYISIPPIALSFACLTNQILDTSCYGKNWIVHDGIGGVLHYGATGTSAPGLNCQLFYSIATFFGPNLNKTISMPLLIGGAKLYSSNPNLSSVRNQTEKYCIYGDPSLLMFGGVRDDVIIQKSNGISSQSKNISPFEQLKDLDTNIEYNLNVFDVSGKILINCNTTYNSIYDRLNILPNGVYFVSLKTNNSSNTYKLIINH